MDLFLDREDLLPQHKDVPCSQTAYEHFKPEVKKAIRIAGKAVFETAHGNYNAIYCDNKTVERKFVKLVAGQSPANLDNLELTESPPMFAKEIQNNLLSLIGIDRFVRFRNWMNHAKPGERFRLMSHIVVICVEG